jgi:hypothetical protein
MQSHPVTGLGTGIAYCDQLRIEINKGITFECTVGFTEQLEQVGMGLLGQHGFFSRYQVLFDRPNEEFCIYVP